MISSQEFALILGSYLLGCLTAGYYWVRWRTGGDIRLLGSGSVGARNVGRIVGAPGFIGTFLADFGKGLVAVDMARRYGAGEIALGLVILAVVAGHNWPVQLRFQGGKGIATSLGAILAYDPIALALLLITFVPLFVVLRNFTLSGLVAFALAPLGIFLCGLGNTEVVAISLLAVLVLGSHHRNIRDEITSHFGFKPRAHSPAEASRYHS